eukprot:8351147-Alexandrium_andersonii.AAC.2
MHEATSESIFARGPMPGNGRASCARQPLQKKTWRTSARGVQHVPRLGSSVGAHAPFPSLALSSLSLSFAFLPFSQCLTMSIRFGPCQARQGSPD